MGCSSPETKDFMAKIGELTSSEMSGNDDHGKKPRLNNDVSDQPRTICLPEENPPVKAQRKIPSTPGKGTCITKEDRLSRQAKPVLSGISARTRPPSLLERSLLPGFRKAPYQFSCSASSQLTMFYAGSVQVYDNVPFDKAQAIMLLAGESSSPRPGFVPQLEEHLLPSICKLEAGLPVARKNSLRRFLEKRHHRITNKDSSWCCKIGTSPRNSGNIRDVEAQNANNNPSLSPFPSRLGYFSPIPTTKGSR